MPVWKDIPWALGAWAVNDDRGVPFEDQVDCLNGIKELLDSGEIPQLKASIYYNSKHGRIADDKQPELLPAFNDFLRADSFTDIDAMLEDNQLTHIYEEPD